MTADHTGAARISPTMVPRVGARIVLLDEDDRVLLIEEAGTDPAGDWHHWLVPGGGVEGDESLPVAATREVVEEIGVRIVLAPDAVPVHRQRRVWGWRGAVYDQMDNLFAARVSRAFDPIPAGLTEMELQTVIGARWWTADEVRASDQTFVPPDIADVVAAIAADESVVRPQHRPAGRVLALDPSGRVLLMLVRPDPGSGTANWITPGGGCEDGESPAQAAVRELAEETGIRAELPGDVVAVEHAVFPFGGRLYDQIDHFFHIRLDDRPAIDSSGLTDGEQAVTLEYRWWSAAALRATSERYWPLDLPDLLDRLVGRIVEIT